MTKNIVYTFTLVFFFTGVAFIINKYIQDKNEEEENVFRLKPRTGLLAMSREWQSTRKMANYYSEVLSRNPGDAKALISLATIFIQESRVTGNYQYYDAVAMRCVNKVLTQDSSNFDALVLKALIHMSQHHFEDGLNVAEKAQKINPYNAFVYGILIDGNVEMGNYTKAVEHADKMVSIRPDLRSYSRISYLREIHGDYPGAIEAMEMAIGAGVPGDEPTEWSRVQLGQLYEYAGNVKSAEMQYLISLQERPGYPYALAGLSRIASSKKEYAKAIAYLEQADSSVNAWMFKEELVKAYKLSGQSKKAEQLSRQVIREMESQSKKAQSDPNTGHYADREMALAYLEVNDLDNALRHALMEFSRRPQNIDVNETVAWVYYQRGEYRKALPYLQTALKTKSRNPVLLNRASLIYSHAGVGSSSGI